MVVNPQEAVIVRKIYKLFLCGLTPHAIAKQLTEEHIPSPAGKSLWRSNTVQSILTNEKYKGDALLQKRFTVDFLTKKVKKNEGEVPQYYVKDDHEAIISSEVFETVQLEMERRRSLKGRRYSGTTIMASKVFCGECGGVYGSKVWHSTDMYKKVILRCNNKYAHDSPCSTPSFTEAEVKGLFVKAVNKLLGRKGEVLENLRQLMSVLSDTSSLEIERDEKLHKVHSLVASLQSLVDFNCRQASDQVAYQRRYNAMLAEYEETKSRYEEITQAIESRRSRSEMLKLFLHEVEERKELLTEFDAALWGSLLDSITAYSEDNVVVRFKDGTEIKVRL